MPFDLSFHRTMARRLQAEVRHLTAWEKTFLAGIAVQDGPPTDKQRDVLRAIEAKQLLQQKRRKRKPRRAAKPAGLRVLHSKQVRFEHHGKFENGQRRTGKRRPLSQWAKMFER